jgi:hypothetical protein
MLENPFVTGAGVSALVHSTWSLGTLFSGEQPAFIYDNVWSYFANVYWLLPALLIAFAMDIGQIETSRKIRHEGLTWQRGLTFFVFALATYYLQFLYIAHHMPALQIQAGVSDFHRIAVTELRNASIWILPALLPLATLLYTLSDDKHAKKGQEHRIKQDVGTQEHEIAIVSVNPDMADWIVDPDSLHEISCPDCDWSGNTYKTERSAQLALQAHRRHCEVSIRVERLN